VEGPADMGREVVSRRTVREPFLDEGSPDGGAVCGHSGHHGVRQVSRPCTSSKGVGNGVPLASATGEDRGEEIGSRGGWCHDDGGIVWGVTLVTVRPSACRAMVTLPRLPGAVPLAVYVPGSARCVEVPPWWCTNSVP
jgi:hypothetical protein